MEFAGADGGECVIAIDLFAGGGGASLGIELALGRDVDLAINHDAVALAAHRANHPRTRHLEASVWDVKPQEAVEGRAVDVLWASPDCTHFSVAKGDVPRCSGKRSLAWAVHRWAKAVRPRVLFIENVREFQGWGPLGKDGRPDKRRAGKTFAAWVGALERLGYAVEWRVLDASAFGAPTRRRRLFIVARCDGQPIRWPAPTHGPGLLPLRTAAECIDWSIPCPSIFERKRPLAAKTMWRIAESLRRFVLESPSPYIVEMSHSNAPRDLAQPLGTIIAGGSGCNGKHALVGAFLAKHFGGVVGHSLDERVATVTARDHHSLAAASLVKLRGDCNGSDLRDPAPTITARGTHIAEVRALLAAHCGPTPRARTLFDAPRGMVMVRGVPHEIVDLGMRMLEPHELLLAQFGEHADGYDLSAASTKEAKVRLIGNSVAPHVAAALVRANVGSSELAEAAS
ncbi:MAG: DNA cytosine methyltransferase [Planctomycetes bacterium]|nr:DNA cytosine methyltransferase [Planctomycetota bacterium]